MWSELDAASVAIVETELLRRRRSAPRVAAASSPSVGAPVVTAEVNPVRVVTRYTQGEARSGCVYARVVKVNNLPVAGVKWTTLPACLATAEDGGVSSSCRTRASSWSVGNESCFSMLWMIAAVE